MTASEIDRFKDFAERLADASREIVGEAIRGPVVGEVKGDGSPVTRIDREVEKRLRDMIALDGFRTMGS